MLCGVEKRRHWNTNFFKYFLQKSKINKFVTYIFNYNLFLLHLYINTYISKVNFL